jgi:hypothetical protein
MRRFRVKDTPVDLKPSFVRTVSGFYLVWFVLLGLSYITGSWVKHAEELYVSLIAIAIPPAALGSLTWFFFVPRRLEFSNTDITIKPALESLRTLGWDELEYFGPGRGVFILQFSGCSPFQIYTLGFRRSEWRLLKRFLYDNFPDRGGFSIARLFVK